MNRCHPPLPANRKTGALAWLLGLLFLAAGSLPAQVTYTWNSGDILTGGITPAGVTTITAVDTLNIVTGNDHDFNGRLVTNNGTVSWQAGRIRSGSGGAFTNNATWNDTSDTYAFNNDYGGAGTTFINAAGGTYNKLSGATYFDTTFANAGTINVSGGTLSFRAGGTFTNGSVVGSSGPGVVQLTSGTLTMTGNITATNFLFNGGTLAGDQTFTGSVLNWQNGVWNSANTTTIASNSTLNITSGNDHDYNAHAIVNNGTVNWQAGRIRSGNGGSITNNGIWNDTSDTYAVNNDYGGAGGASFINAAGGTYNKTTGTTTFNIGLSNYGSVVVSGGVLNLAAGGTFYDGSSIGSTGTGVAQLTGGVLTAGGTAGFTATNFLLTAGQLAGNMTFLGTTSWVGSNFNTAGTATIGAAGILNITTGSDHDFNAHAIVNNGTVNWLAGRIRSGNGGTITNNASWNDSSNGYAINNDYGGAGGTTFTNAVTGIYNKTAGTTTFSNGTLVNNGLISVADGATLNLDGGTLNSGSTIGSTGTGVVQLVSGGLTVNGPVNFQNFFLTGGQLLGNQTFAGTLNWLATDLGTTGTTTLGNGSTFTISTGADHNFNSRVIVNNGTVNWFAGRIRSGNGGTITNNATWNDSSNGYAINNDYGGAGGTTFTNAATGVYNKTAGTTTFSNGTLVNNGLVSVADGATLNLDGGTLNSGSTIGSTGTGVVQLVSGGLTVNGTVNVQNLQLANGQLIGNQTFAGTLSWLATDFGNTGTTTIGNGSTFTISTGADHNFNSHTLVNNGTVNWVAGRLRSGSGGTITNNATWNDSSSGYAVNNDYGGAGGTTYINAATGVYNKTSGTTTFLTTLTNAGTINVTGGSTLSLASTFNNTGTVAVAAGATVNSPNALTFGAGSLLSGSGLVSAPSLSLAGTIAPGAAATPGLLSITGDLGLLATAQAAFDLGGTTQGTQYDALIVNGNFTLGGNLAVKVLSSFTSTINYAMTFDVVAGNSILSSFANVANGSRIATSDGLFTFAVNYGPGSTFATNKVVLSNFSAVPEPSTWALLLAGSGYLTIFVRRRRS